MLESSDTYFVVRRRQLDYPVHGPGCDEPVDTVVRRERGTSALSWSAMASWAGSSSAWSRSPSAGLAWSRSSVARRAWERPRSCASSVIAAGPACRSCGEPASRCSRHDRSARSSTLPSPCEGELGGLIDEGAKPHAVASALLRELQQDATPSLVVLEDLHWADEATLDVLRLTARRLAGVGALILLTYRNDELGRWHPLRVLIGELGASQTIVRMSLDAPVAGRRQVARRAIRWRRRDALPPHGRQPVLRHRAAGRHPGHGRDAAGQRRRRRPGPGGPPEPGRPPAAGGDRRRRPTG